MRKRFVEVEIGRDSVRLAQWERGHLVREYTEPLPENYISGREIVSMEALGKWLRDTAKRHGLKGRRCRLILPPHLTYMRAVKLPGMTKEQILLNLPYEFRDFIKGHMEQYRFEYVVTDTVRDSSGRIVEVWVMALAASEALVEEYRYMLRGAGWKLDFASTEVFVYSDRIRQMERAAARECPGDYCLVVPGIKVVNVYFYKGCHLMAYRELETGNRLLMSDEDFAHLGGNLCQTLEFYHHRYPENQLEVIHICGEGRESERLKFVLEKMWGVRCEKAPELLYVLPAGKSPVNLARRNSILRHPGKVFAMVLGCLLFLGCFGWFAVRLPLEEMKQSRAKLSRLAVDLSTYRDSNSDYESVEAEYQRYFATYLTQEEEGLTKRYDMLQLVRRHTREHGVIHQVSIEHQECRLMVGELTLLQVSELVERLEEEPVVNYVEVLEIAAEQGEAGHGKPDDTESDDTGYGGMGSERSIQVTASLLIVLEGGGEDAS